MFLTKIFKKLLQYFIKNSNQIALFPHPENEGVMESRQAKEIMKVLEDKGPYLDSINISASIKAKQHISDWVKLINDKIDEIIKLKVSLIITKIRTLVKTEAYLSLIQKLKEIQLASIALKNTQDEKQFFEEFKRLEEVLFIKDKNHDEIQEAYIEALTFFNKIYKIADRNFSGSNQINKIKVLCDVFLIRLEPEINHQTLEF